MGCIGCIWEFLENTKIRHNSYNLQDMEKSLFALIRVISLENHPEDFVISQKTKKLSRIYMFFIWAHFCNSAREGGADCDTEFFC